VSTGKTALSPRERDVLRQLRRGHPNKLIARELNISESTVKIHVMNIMRKVDARNRTEAVLRTDRFLAEG